jgi:hypothetical protein
MPSLVKRLHCSLPETLRGVELLTGVGLLDGVDARYAGDVLLDLE